MSRATRLNPRVTKAELAVESAIRQQIANLITGQFPTPSQRKLVGPVATGVTVNLGIAPNVLVYDRQYPISGGVLPAGWPVDSGDAPIQISSNYIGYYDGIQTRTYRYMCDGIRTALLMSSGTAFQNVWGDFLVFIDGVPVSLVPYDPAAGSTYTEFVFADARPRLIEVLTSAPLSAVYTSKPYRCWQPPVPAGLKGLLVGDSYSAGVTPNGGNIASTTWGDNFSGFASQLGLEIGINRWSTDGVGGTGYIRVNGSYGNYNDRRAEHIARAPDVLIVGGGGANDLTHGSTVADVVAAAITYFTAVRAALPNTKLIFLEGFTPPGGGFASLGPSYISVRTQLQAALTSIGVYYIDIATSAAWLDGTGWTGSRVVTDGVLNSTTTLTSATAAFTSADVGVYITGTGIPAGAKIASVTNATTVVLSAAATATASGVSVTITTQKGDGNNDVYVGQDAVHLTPAGSRYILKRLAPKIKQAITDNGALLNQLI